MQFLQAEHLTQTRSLPVSATRRRLCGGVPRRRSTKYWPEPKDAPEMMGDLKDGRLWWWVWRSKRRWVSKERAWDGDENGVLWSNGSFRYSSLELQMYGKVKRMIRHERREIEESDSIVFEKQRKTEEE